MHVSKHCRTPLCHISPYVGVLVITGLWIVYIALLVLHPELLEINKILLQIHLWYAICAIITTLVASIETARHLKEEQTDTDHALCTQEA
jgi:hypothetical protein